MSRFAYFLPPRIRLRVLLACALVYASAAIFVGRAVAEEPSRCAPLAEIEAGLVERYGELLAAVGITSTPMGPGAMRFYVSPTVRSWTLLAVMPNGMACMLQAGANFDYAKLPPVPNADKKADGPVS